MEHQDFKTLVFSQKEKKAVDQNKKEVQKRISQKQVTSNDNEVVKVQADKKLGQLLSQARLAKGFKTQGDFIEVLETIASGTEIISEGARSVNDGQKVEIKNQ